MKKVGKEKIGKKNKFKNLKRISRLEKIKVASLANNIDSLSNQKRKVEETSLSSFESNQVVSSLPKKQKGEDNLISNFDELTSLDLSASMNISIPEITTTQPKASNERIQIIAEISSETIIYRDNLLQNCFVLNNYSSLIRFIDNCKSLVPNEIRLHQKALYHIQVEGYAKTGKTTLATVILPYLLSHYKYNHYSKYRTIVINTELKYFDKDDSFGEYILTILYDELNITPPGTKPFIHHPLFWPLWLKTNLDPNTFYFFCLDEIQLLSERAMTEAKHFFKSGNNPINMIAIITGSSQSVFLKRIASVRSNGFSLLESVGKFVIPKGATLNQVQETIVGLNSIYNTRISLENIKQLKNVFREIQLAHLTMLYSGEYNVQTLFNEYERIYQRDIPLLTIKELSESDQQMIELLLKEDNSSIERNENEPDDFDFFFEKQKDQSYQPRDIVLDKVLQLRFSIDPTTDELVYKSKYTR